MQTYLDCMPCFVRQALECARMASADSNVHECVLREILRDASDMDMRASPVEMAVRIHRLTRSLTGNSDPYAAIKERFNRLALALYPEMRRMVREAQNPLDVAIRLAIAGNVIDCGPGAELSESYIESSIRASLDAPFDADVEEFARAVDEADSVLYLADNAGEIVFDKLLLEQLPAEKFTVAVRGAPILNDATLADAEFVSLRDVVEVIENGSDAPGTMLEACSPEFRRRFEFSDLIVSKGQGNYETVSGAQKDIFFILKAKCPVVARDLGCPVGSLQLRRSNLEEASAGAINAKAGEVGHKGKY